jgi:hypothetical protein
MGYKCYSLNVCCLTLPDAESLVLTGLWNWAWRPMKTFFIPRQQRIHTPVFLFHTLLDTRDTEECTRRLIFYLFTFCNFNWDFKTTDPTRSETFCGSNEFPKQYHDWKSSIIFHIRNLKFHQRNNRHLLLCHITLDSRHRIATPWRRVLFESRELLIKSISYTYFVEPGDFLAIFFINCSTLILSWSK